MLSKCKEKPTLTYSLTECKFLQLQINNSMEAPPQIKCKVITLCEINQHYETNTSFYLSSLEHENEIVESS